MFNSLNESSGACEVIIVCGLILLLFGGIKLPKLMRGLDEGIREFNRGLRRADEGFLPERPHERPPARLVTKYKCLIVLIIAELIVLLVLLARR